MTQSINNFNGKILKKILVASKDYDANVLSVEINSTTYRLDRLNKINNVVVYSTNCEMELHNDVIRYAVSNIDANTHSIYYDDDGYYNHVNDLCKYACIKPVLNNGVDDYHNNISLYTPTADEISYSMPIILRRSAISLFITK